MQLRHTRKPALLAALLMLLWLWIGITIEDGELPQQAVAAASLVMVVIPFFLIARAGNLAVLLVAAFLYGAGQANLQPMMNALVLQGIEPGQRGRVTAFFSASGDVAYGGGAMLWGYVASLCGFRMMFVMCGVCAACGIVLYAWFARRRARSVA